MPGVSAEPTGHKAADILLDTSFRAMATEPKKTKVKVEIEVEGELRFLVTTYSDGEQSREPIVKLPRKKRYPDRPYWRWGFDKSRKKGV